MTGTNVTTLPSTGTGAALMSGTAIGAGLQFGMTFFFVFGLFVAAVTVAMMSVTAYNRHRMSRDEHTD